mmetsp:Transcript_15586/g.46696  ORF Transcript_15586/g.46696 Transcript_15586/m.46696 type:complete len:253 (-) Transcript_15586:1944-2702(-)
MGRARPAAQAAALPACARLRASPAALPPLLAAGAASFHCSLCAAHACGAQRAAGHRRRGACSAARVWSRRARAPDRAPGPLGSVTAARMHASALRAQSAPHASPRRVQFGPDDGRHERRARLATLRLPGARHARTVPRRAGAGGGRGGALHSGAARTQCAARSAHRRAVPEAGARPRAGGAARSAQRRPAPAQRPDGQLPALHGGGGGRVRATGRAAALRACGAFAAARTAARPVGGVGGWRASRRRRGAAR